MRKFQPRTGSRPLRAGVAVVATAAAVVAGTALPVLAAATGTLDIKTAPIGGGNTIKFTSAGALTGVTAAAARYVASTASCELTFGTTSTTKLAGTAALITSNVNDVNLVVPALAAGTYKTCLYTVTTGTSVGSNASLNANTTTDNLVVSAASTTPTATPSASAAGVATAVAATGIGPYASGAAATPGVTFRTTTCPAAYGTVASPVIAVTGSTKSTDGKTINFTTPVSAAANTYNVCFYAGVTNTSALLGSITYALLPSATLSPSSGNSGGTNTIIMSTKSAVVTSSPAAIFTKATSCPVNVAAATSTDYTSGTVQKISTTKAAILVPTDVKHDTADAETTTYNVCLYSDNTTGKLVAAPPAYTVAVALDLSTVAIDPASGPSQGSSTIEVTVVGGIPTATGATLSASLGGSALENITVLSDKSFTATTTSHGAGGTKLSVTTAAGTQTSGTTDFTFTYGITSSPTTVASGADNPTMDILGAGFSDLIWGDDATTATAPTAGAHVFLVDNSWFTATSGTGTALNSGLITECLAPNVISDNELICELDIANTIESTHSYIAQSSGSPVPVGDGSYQLVVTNSLTRSLSPQNYSQISSGSVFTVADY